MISGILACLSAVLLTSCQKQVSEVQTGSVSLSIGFPGSLDVEDGPWTRAYVDASKYEGIKTLRLIVISGTPDQVDRKILYNQKVQGLENASGYQTNIPNLPVGQMSFYAIANEESIGMTYDDKTILDNLIDGPENAGRRKLLFKDESRQYFPCTGRNIVDNGLPMSGYTTENITGDQNIEIELYRSVVKLALVVENTTTPSIETIPAGGRTDTLSLYFYPTQPSFSGEGPFTIGIETTENDYGQVLFAPGETYFIRNTQINLLAQITTTVGIKLSFTVQPWDDYTVDVPSFN